MRKATPAEVVPTKPGTPFGGGIYMGRYFEGIEARALILAPRDEGEIKTTHADALNQAKACRIAEHKDWQVPSRLQALTLWLNRKALKKDQSFEAAWYWTRDKYELDAGYAWIQSFGYGGQDGIHVVTSHRARFVRSVTI